MKYIILLIIITFASLTCAAQETGGWEESFRQWIDTDESGTASLEEAYDVLTERSANPINLNQTSREELEQLPFLTPQQIEDILAYINRYGVIRSTGELQMVTSLDAERRQLLKHFVYIGEAKKKSSRLRIDSVFLHGNHQLLVTGKIPLYTRKGDRKGYMGSRYQHNFRYQLNYHERVKVGVTGAKDAGEPFFKDRNRWGYDHYSYYLQLKDIGCIRNLCVGMYRVQQGMGLIMNGGFYLGKLSTLQSLGNSTAILRPHSSRSTEGYLQGIATTIRLHRHWQLTAFASYRPLDATLNKDSTARTLYYTNYHRTETEMSKKNNTHETNVGGSIGWRRGTLFARANILYAHFDRRLTPQKENSPHRRYAAEGQDFMNMSMDYGYTNARFSFSGETAVNKEGALATIHQLSYRISHPLTVMLLHRYYDKRYTALHARSFHEGSDVQNEHGIYAGITWQPSTRWTLNWYADYAHFPWKRYQVSMSSDAFDTMLLMRTLFNNKWRLEGRYRLHIRQKDNDEKTMLRNRVEQRARIRLSYDSPHGLSLQTQLDGTDVSYKSHDRGYMISQQVAYAWKRIRLCANVSYFHTDNYESRLYLYEHSVLYNFSSLMLYGKGIRYALMAGMDLGTNLTLTAKIGTTNYFDRSTISSSYQEIDGSSMTDVDVQLKCRF